MVELIHWFGLNDLYKHLLTLTLNVISPFW